MSALVLRVTATDSRDDGADAVHLPVSGRVSMLTDEGVKYDRLSVTFVNAIKEQQAQIERQRKQIDEWKELVCRAHPATEVCKQ